MSQIFPTVSFHMVKPCNMKCKFCYATFQDMTVIQQMSWMDCMKVIAKLHKAGVQKITFAGGEPLLYKHLLSAITYAKKLGMTTSIITNGSLLTRAFLNAVRNDLDWIGISIDSLNHKTNLKIGRVAPKALHRFDRLYYTQLLSMIGEFDFKIKINTVVNAYNWKENLSDWMLTIPEPISRWKVFQALPVEGQNDEHFNEIRVTDAQYRHFLSANANNVMVAEDNHLMTGSYLLIDPQGRLFENSSGKHTYSDSLITHDMQHCLDQLNLSYDRFVERGGIYNW